MGSLLTLLGRFSPQHRKLSEWGEIYDKIISARPYCHKTLSNRRSNVAHLLRAFGDRRIGSIRPHELAVWLKDMHQTVPVTTRRVLVESREVFDLALQYGWLTSNPTISLRHLPVRIQRRRLRFEQWARMFDLAGVVSPAWVRPMLALGLVTGQRRADLRSMVFSDIRPHERRGREAIECLHIVQQKTGTRIALPTLLHLDVLGMSVGSVIAMCRDYGRPGSTLLRKSNGMPLTPASLSARFQELFELANGPWDGDGAPPSLHECRSLSERLYRQQGVDTRRLLGHKRQAMTDIYNDDRGLSRGEFQLLEL